MADRSSPRTYMEEAIHLAAENVGSGRGGPFGCVVVREGRVIARGVNLVTSTHDPTAHAEVVAIRRACEVLRSHQLTGCEVYTSCEPCPMCFGALQWARPDRVYYAASKDDASAAGFDDGVILEQIVVPPERRTIPTVRLMEEEGRLPFRLWTESPDRKTY